MNYKVTAGIFPACAAYSTIVIFYEEPANVRSQVHRLVSQPAVWA